MNRYGREKRRRGREIGKEKMRGREKGIGRDREKWRPIFELFSFGLERVRGREKVRKKVLERGREKGREE